MKPLFRVTVGPVQSWGLKLLKKNVQLLKKNYPEADVVICYNQIDCNEINTIKAHLYNQFDYRDELEYKPRAESWKLYPPRLRLESHEIVMDNDILLFRRVPEIDEFLISNKTLLLKGRYRVYGKYDHKVPQPYAINSGIYGLPPHFDFKKEIEMFLDGEILREWTEWCDDQGVVAGTLLKHDHIIIDMESVMNYLPESNYMPRNWNGIHMMGANRGAACIDLVKQLLIEL